MSVELNLLPDIKKQYIKAQRSKRFIISLSVIIVAVCVGLVVLMFSYTNVAQKIHIDNLQKSIDEAHKKIRETPDIERILTVKNQLNALPGLHDQKPAITRLGQYLTVLVPTNVKLSEISLDFENKTVTIQGNSGDFKAINTFADTLKNAQFSHKNQDDEVVTAQAFTNVTLQEIGRTEQEGSSFTIMANFDELIFSNTVVDLVFTVPNIVTGQTETNQAQGVFNPEEAQ